MTGQAELVTVATLTATTGVVLAAAMRTWVHAERRQNAARDAGVVTGRHDPARAAHGHTDEGDPDA